MRGVGVGRAGMELGAANTNIMPAFKGVCTRGGERACGGDDGTSD